MQSLGSRVDKVLVFCREKGSLVNFVDLDGVWTVPPPHYSTFGLARAGKLVMTTKTRPTEKRFTHLATILILINHDAANPPPPPHSTHLDGTRPIHTPQRKQPTPHKPPPWSNSPRSKTSTFSTQRPRILKTTKTLATPVRLSPPPTHALRQPLPFPSPPLPSPQTTNPNTPGH